MRLFSQVPSSKRIADLVISGQVDRVLTRLEILKKICAIVKTNGERPIIDVGSRDNRKKRRNKSPKLDDEKKNEIFFSRVLIGST